MSNLLLLLLPSSWRDRASYLKDKTAESQLEKKLGSVIERFGNECQTPYPPATLSFNRFVLGAMTSFELVITKDDQRESIRFEEKQGLLAPVLLGEIFPLENGSPEPVHAIIDKFVHDYEQFKNSSWQIL